MSEGVQVQHVFLSFTALVAAMADCGYTQQELNNYEKLGFDAKFQKGNDASFLNAIYAIRVTRENYAQLLSGGHGSTYNAAWISRALKGDTVIKKALEDPDNTEVFQIVFDGDSRQTAEITPRIIQRYKYNVICGIVGPGQWVEEFTDANGLIAFDICENDDRQAVAI